jgi:tetratricopeptide (TPR) repeat protein
MAALLILAAGCRKSDEALPAANPGTKPAGGTTAMEAQGSATDGKGSSMSMDGQGSSSGAGAAAQAGPVPLFDNLGNYSRKVTTSSPRAQLYFDQGLRLQYGFNPEEGHRAFKEAAKLDPDCAMAYWGIALSLGSNINVPRLPDQELEAYEAIQKALALAPKASPVERDFIAALATRYNPKAGADGKALDIAYAQAMKGLSQKYPDDLDAATLYAESLMDLHPWQLWTNDGTPQSDTPEIVSTLESVLARNPDHPGANHYYIHALEASPHPEKALASAQRIPGLMPGAGHLVHMPFHIYYRLGRWNDAAAANQNAIVVDKKYIDMCNPQGLYPLMYYTHDFQSLCASAAMDGRSAEALDAARNVTAIATPESAVAMPMAEFVTPFYLWTLARFGRWDDILQQPPVTDKLPYLTGMWHYTRGLAYARKGKLPEAGKELDALSAVAKATPPDLPEGLNKAGDLFKVAQNQLAGEIAAAQGRKADAIRLLTEAVRAQDALSYDEPPAWYMPVRQSLGAELLAAGKPSEAGKVYLQDLERNPENGWSLYGLHKALLAQNKTADAAQVESRLHSAWARADVTLTASRF